MSTLQPLLKNLIVFFTCGGVLALVVGGLVFGKTWKRSTPLSRGAWAGVGGLGLGVIFCVCGLISGGLSDRIGGEATPTRARVNLATIPAKSAQTTATAAILSIATPTVAIMTDAVQATATTSVRAIELSTPTDSPMQTDTPVVTSAPVKPMATAKEGKVNIRSGPGKEYNISGSLAQGESLEIIGRNADSSWWQVSPSNGWVSVGVVIISNIDDTIPIVEVPTPLVQPASTEQPPTPTVQPTPTEQPPTPTIIPTLPPVSSGGDSGSGGGSGCCKHCGSNSKACGDSCIPLNYTCHKGPGCACD